MCIYINVYIHIYIQTQIRWHRNEIKNKDTKFTKINYITYKYGDKYGGNKKLIMIIIKITKNDAKRQKIWNEMKWNEMNTWNGQYE